MARNIVTIAVILIVLLLFPIACGSTTTPLSLNPTENIGAIQTRAVQDVIGQLTASALKPTARAIADANSDDIGSSCTDRYTCTHQSATRHIHSSSRYGHRSRDDWGRRGTGCSRCTDPAHRPARLGHHVRSRRLLYFARGSSWPSHNRRAKLVLCERPVGRFCPGE